MATNNSNEEYTEIVQEFTLPITYCGDDLLNIENKNQDLLNIPIENEDQTLWDIPIENEDQNLLDIPIENEDQILLNIYIGNEDQNSDLIENDLSSLNPGSIFFSETFDFEKVLEEAESPVEDSTEKAFTEEVNTEGDFMSLIEENLEHPEANQGVDDYSLFKEIDEKSLITTASTPQPTLPIVASASAGESTHSRKTSNPKELELLFDNLLDSIRNNVGNVSENSPYPSPRRDSSDSPRRDSSDSGGGKMYSSNAERCRLNREKKKMSMKENEQILDDFESRNRKLTALHRMLETKTKKIKDFYIAAL